MAMFLKLQFLEGKNEENYLIVPPTNNLCIKLKTFVCQNGEFDKMRAGGGSAVAYAWYVWQKGHKGNTIVKWIN